MSGPYGGGFNRMGPPGMMGRSGQPHGGGPGK
jgi:hypothetical protein